MCVARASRGALLFCFSFADFVYCFRLYIFRFRFLFPCSCILCCRVLFRCCILFSFVFLCPFSVFCFRFCVFMFSLLVFVVCLWFRFLFSMFVFCFRCFRASFDDYDFARGTKQQRRVSPVSCTLCSQGRTASWHCLSNGPGLAACSLCFTRIENVDMKWLRI